MQVRKEDIRQTVLDVASKEFMLYGFKDTSMRSIAKQAGVTLSNIYNYFRNKDEIFVAVLTPLLNAFEQLSEKHNSSDYITIDVFNMQSYQRRMIDEFSPILKERRLELKLLLFGAGGSSLENFRDTFTQRHSQNGLEYMKLMRSKYPNIYSDVSPFFIHIVSSCLITILGEIVSHDELMDSEIEQFLTEYIAFGTAGWKQLMRI